jgi:hypothetical protein
MSPKSNTTRKNLKCIHYIHNENMKICQQVYTLLDGHTRHGHDSNVSLSHELPCVPFIATYKRSFHYQYQSDRKKRHVLWDTGSKAVCADPKCSSLLATT